MKLLITILLVLATGLTAQAQEDTLARPRGGIIPMEGSFLRQRQQRDSVLIGDQLDYGITLKDVTPGTEFLLPDWSKKFRDSLEVVGSWQTDTVKTHKAGRNHKVYDIEMYSVITGFDEGTFALPPVAVVRRLEDGQVDTLVFESKQLEICTMPVDTAIFKPHDIKAQIGYPVTFGEVAPWAGGGLLAAGLIALIWWLIARRLRRSEEEKEKLEPAHIVALRKLDKLRGNKYWAPEKQKFFYSGVTDALREYMARRYEIGAMEMTTAEIFEALRDTDVPKYLYTDMKGLFERSDFVKFAKLTLPDEENAKVLPAAIRFVTSTYQSDVEEESRTVEEAQGGEEPAGNTDPTPMKEVKPENDDSRYMPK